MEIQTKMKKRIQLIVLLAAMCIFGTVLIPAKAQYEYNSEANYASYYDQGVKFYNSGEYTKAIEQFTQALKMAPENAAIRNNIAVSLISRGTYYHNTAKNFEEAIDNYLSAIYYLKYDAPKDAPQSQNAPGNLSIAYKNYSNALASMGVKINTPAFHINKAKEYRAKGKFRSAIVEYFMALEKSPADTSYYEAIGDMYMILQNDYRASQAYDKISATKPGNAQLYVKIGMANEKNNNLNEAIKSYDKATSIDPKNMEALSALERIWGNQIKLNPRNVAAHANLGAVLQKKGEFDSALAQYNAAEAIDPNNIFVRLNLGTLYQAKGDFKTAIKAYDTILQVDPNNKLARYYKATALKTLKDYDGANRELNYILQKDPGYDLAKKELLEISKLSGQSSPVVIGLLKDMAEKDPTNIKAQYDAAFEAHSKGDIDTAIYYYKRAIALDSNMSDAYANLGSALYSKKKYEEALPILERATMLDPGNENVKKLISEIKSNQKSSKYQEALTLHQQGKIKDAIPIYLESLKADPNNPEILTNLGAAYQSLKSYDSAIEMYKKAVGLSPNTAVTYYYLANCLFAKNMLREAVANYNKAISIEPNNQNYKDGLKAAQANLADTLLSDSLKSYNAKQYQKAQGLIQESLKYSPNNAVAYYYLGLVSDAQNNAASAVNHYRRSIQLDPNMENSYYALALDLDKMKDIAGAKEAFTKYLQIAGNRSDAFVNYAKARLKQLQ